MMRQSGWKTRHSGRYQTAREEELPVIATRHKSHTVSEGSMHIIAKLMAHLGIVADSTCQPTR